MLYPCSCFILIAESEWYGTFGIQIVEPAAFMQLLHLRRWVNPGKPRLMCGCLFFSVPLLGFWGLVLLHRGGMPWGLRIRGGQDLSGGLLNSFKLFLCVCEWVSHIALLVLQDVIIDFWIEQPTDIERIPTIVLNNLHGRVMKVGFLHKFLGPTTYMSVKLTWQRHDFNFIQ